MIRPGIVAVGEGMLEVSGPLGGAARFAFGGDALNTAVYLSRLGAPCSFLTALGSDPFSEDMRTAWRAEGLALDLVLTHPLRQPGLYAIRTAADGERSFQYWRAESAARDMFALPEIEAALAAASGAILLYLSGITLSLFAEVDRARLVALARQVRARGGRVAFDPNFRPRGWANPAAAQRAFAAIAPHVDIALPTLADERLLDGKTDERSVAARWLGAGADEVVVKLGADGAYCATPDHLEHVRGGRVDAVDTTGAGDSFNAAYLAARLSGTSPVDAVRAGHALASVVVAHPGAIIPRAAMAGLVRPGANP